MRTVWAWLTDRPWWRWQSAAAAGVLGLGISALGGWATSLLDEIGDNRATEALARANERDAYEAECRFGLAQPVEQLESEQFDLLVDMAIARARQDVAELQRLLERLTDIRERKAIAVADRAGAVVECNQRAGDLFDPGS